MIPTAANSEIRIRRAYQSAGIFRAAFQIGFIVRSIAIGPLNITTARINATTTASDSTAAPQVARNKSLNA
jgi:hypothetical protein